MKKLAILGVTVCSALLMTSCKSRESAYRKAYDLAKQQELAEQPEATTPPAETVTPVPVVPAAQPQQVTVVESAPANDVRQERVTVVAGADGLKDYSVVCGSFQVQGNAEGLKRILDAEGYNAVVVRNDAANMYRVIVSTHADRASAAAARDAFKARYPNRKDFQGSWLLYRVK